MGRVAELEVAEDLDGLAKVVSVAETEKVLESSQSRESLLVTILFSESNQSVGLCSEVRPLVHADNQLSGPGGVILTGQLETRTELQERRSANEATFANRGSHIDGISTGRYGQRRV